MFFGFTYRLDSRFPMRYAQSKLHHQVRITNSSDEPAEFRKIAPRRLKGPNAKKQFGQAAFGNELVGAMLCSLGSSGLQVLIASLEIASREHRSS